MRSLFCHKRVRVLLARPSHLHALVGTLNELIRWLVNLRIVAHCYGGLTDIIKTTDVPSNT